jgi:hypothetical protein
VVGLPEGTGLAVEGVTVRLIGGQACRLFRSGADPADLPPGADLDFLLRP